MGLSLIEVGLIGLSSTKLSVSAFDMGDVFGDMSFAPEPLLPNADLGSNTMIIGQKFTQSPTDLLTKILTTSQLDLLFDHGCYCTRLNDEDPEIGGNQTVDELDHLCKKWRSTRCCQEVSGGACYDLESVGFNYQVTLEDGGATCDTDNLYNPFYIFNQCELDSCIIDTHYAFLIKDYLDAHPNQVQNVVDAGSCKVDGDVLGRAGVRFCEGIAPNLHFVIKDDPCLTAAFDLTIVMDGSGSIGPYDYDQGVDFVKGITDKLNLGYDATRVSLIQFSYQTKPYAIFKTNEGEVNGAIEKLRESQFGESTYTNVALYATNYFIEKYGRPGVSQIVILITDGKSQAGIMFRNRDGTFLDTAKQLHDRGAHVYTIGVGTDVSETELKYIASDPDNEHYKALVDYSSLNSVSETILSSMCSQGQPRSGRSSGPRRSSSNSGELEEDEITEFFPDGTFSGK